MNDELVFYTHPMSRGRIVRWMLEEVGQPYRTEILGYGASMKEPGYLAVNPMGKVPALVHGSEIVTEAAAICTYLADAFPQAGLVPQAGSLLRAAYYRWLFFTAGPMESAIINQVMKVEVPARMAHAVGYGSLALVTNVVEAAVSGRDYVVGDCFTTADLVLGSQLSWGLQFNTIEARPALTGYVEKLRSRAAYMRATEIDDALLAQAQEKASAD